MKIIAGNSNKSLAEAICAYNGVSLADTSLRRFADREIFVEINENIRGEDVFIIQSTSHPANDHLMELLITIDALKRASASSITAVIPHYAYARQDRKVSPRTPVSAKLLADLITVAGATRVITMDLHAGQIQGFFNIPFDNIYASPILLKYIKNEILSDSTICISPDSGGVERVRHYAKKLKCDLAMIDKRRTGKNVAKAMNIVGDVEGKDCVIIDDMIDTAGTLVEACKALKNGGALKVYCCATHPVFSGPALKRIAECDELEQVICSDTIPLTEEAQKIQKIKVLSTSELLSKAIHRTFNNDSVSSLFV